MSNWIPLQNITTTSALNLIFGIPFWNVSKVYHSLDLHHAVLVIIQLVILLVLSPDFCPAFEFICLAKRLAATAPHAHPSLLLLGVYIIEIQFPNEESKQSKSSNLKPFLSNCSFRMKHDDLI